MTDPIITAAQAEILALTESLRAQSVRLAKAETRIAERDAVIAKLSAVLIQHGLATADEATEPEDDREAAQ